MIGGILPAGLTLNPNGSLAGTPQVAGTTNIGIGVRDANGVTWSQGYQLIIAGESISLGPASLPDAVGNQPYFAQLTASGGTAPYTFKMSFATNWAPAWL